MQSIWFLTPLLLSLSTEVSVVGVIQIF